MSDKKPRGRVGSTGNKMRMTLGLPTSSRINCADNTGAKEMNVIAVKCIQGRLNRLPAASVAEMCVASCRKGKPEYRKKVVPIIIVRQRRPWHRQDGTYIYMEDNACVICNPKGEMKGTQITGPVAKEAAEIWPKVSSHSDAIV
ncbi:putative 60S ribosomal protein L23 [Monocercomonoides exilis]|uniref:putative 60S ribosomal protein L23 n=1 Tax=Monocercomonoides exilis TaxID=2049356 RepID=UPI003559679D|nr:putative 60S ribosomal protein L23 [Monocercomonoides exilis]KAH7831769.1 putative 60S ribosomal protein L23 [Monocercomonoides exilis]|eukprot:MONOS_7763.1-p1 / transcript=MONOS_7763.1 / gene=MONOS_7763 / organism=Monocercomonoides_exilis_PA203 / gene_product=60S ribosomal protein L23 / transcript_product=60S ribosomal protein L23 / location=Mono_scaffold00274:20506-21050(-) / protein_length=143 / sequence_SO=supercontig / SO=protein_coding / is_pseudo=false